MKNKTCCLKKILLSSLFLGVVQSPNAIVLNAHSSKADLLPTISSEVRAQEGIVSASGDPKNLCGIYALYSALQLLGVERISFDQLLSEFPAASLEGTSLLEIQGYLAKQGKFSSLGKICTKDFAKLPAGSLSFVLQKEGTQPHLVLLYKSAEKGVQLFNFPASVRTLKETDLSTTERTCLFVMEGGKRGNFWDSLSPSSRLSILGGVLGFSLLALATLGVRFILKKKAIQ